MCTHAGLRSAALWWLMSRHSSVEGGGVPEMLERLRQVCGMQGVYSSSLILSWAHDMGGHL